jgi:hypothetical protein
MKIDGLFRSYNVLSSYVNILLKSRHPFAENTIQHLRLKDSRILGIASRSSSALPTEYALSLLFTSPNRKKSECAKSGEYGGYDAFVIILASMKLIDKLSACGLALSTWTINVRKRRTTWFPREYLIR